MTFRHLFAVCLTSGSLALAGCGSGSSKSGLKSASEEQAEIEAVIAKLPAADKQLALAQKVCPITGERIGSMGLPPRTTIKGETVFLCCLACKGEAEADPDKTLKAVAASKADIK